MSDFGTISNLLTIPTPVDDGSFAERKARNWQQTVASVTSGQNDPKLEMSGEILPPTSGQIEPKSMTFRELDQAIDGELCRVRDHLIPYLVRMRELLSDQGQRTDLPADIPKKLTWQSWIESKKAVLGSISTVNRMLREAYDEEHKKKTCAECGKTKGHSASCHKYVPPDPELTALEKKFVGSALRQLETVKDFHAGRTDAETALKTLVTTIPTHEALEEYTSRAVLEAEDEAKKKTEEAKKKLEEQGTHIAELGLEIARLNAENRNLQERLTGLANASNNLSDEAITRALSAEPDTAVASKMLTDELARVSNHVLPAHMALKVINASVQIAGRDHRIMVGDYLEKEIRSTAPKKLCKCTGIGECEQRRRVREWNEGKWQKEHVVYHERESDFRVISEPAARKLAPEAFPSPMTPVGL